MKYLWLWLLISLAGSSYAQFQSVKIGVDGLTCSQCSRSVEMQLRKLDFVKDVKMDLSHTEGLLSLKPNKKVAFHQIAKAIENAGFSVRYIKTSFKTDAISTKGTNCFTFKTDAYIALDPVPETQKVISMELVGQGMSTKQLYKKNQKKIEAMQADCAAGAEHKYYYILAE
ncbi:hypothetical protein DBR32_03425 [Taibaiella sp. KBW10]|uniref:heavy-metal-associated domain-containing protein n=1 Tax=Taibaiella sp. KBW10 TaxID=2153357 RepID=UPI000F5B5FCC|nr:cation transporter [Taibaiella sp. KBW10]RQO31868.1 hypothetical protein DBR32_03425 [Taibaiella sp. KBW10]